MASEFIDDDGEVFDPFELSMDDWWEWLCQIKRERDQARAEAERAGSKLVEEQQLSRSALAELGAEKARRALAESEAERLTAERDEAREWGERFGIRRGTSIGDIVLEMDRRHQEAVECLTAELAAERERSSKMASVMVDMARAAIAEPPAAWQRKPVTHEWAWVHAPSGETLYVIEALQRGYTVAPFVSGLGCPAKRPIEPSERGEP